MWAGMLCRKGFMMTGESGHPSRSCSKQGQPQLQIPLSELTENHICSPLLYAPPVQARWIQQFSVLQIGQ